MELLCFTGAKGGVGTSFAVACLSAMLSRIEKKCVAVDLHGGMRTLDLYMGTDGDFVFDLHDVLSGNCSFGDAVVKSACGADFVSCSQTKEFGQSDYDSMYKLLCDNCSEYDYVLLDYPRSFTDTELLAGCSKVAVVTNCDKASVRCTEKLVTALPAAANKFLIINNIVPELISNGYNINVDDICDLCGVPPLGLIPYEPEAVVWDNAHSLLQNDSLTITQAFANVAQRLENNHVCAVSFDYRTPYYKYLKKISRR